MEILNYLMEIYLMIIGVLDLIRSFEDNLETCDRDFCINEVQELQKQIENYENIQEEN